MTHRIYKMPLAKIYPHYVTKVEKKNCTKEELDTIIEWLTGYHPTQLQAILDDETDFETFFERAPRMNPNRNLVTGVICGVRIENIEEPLMKEIRILDKMVDECAKGRPLNKIFREV